MPLEQVVILDKPFSILYFFEAKEIDMYDVKDWAGEGGYYKDRHRLMIDVYEYDQGKAPNFLKVYNTHYVLNNNDFLGQVGSSSGPVFEDSIFFTSIVEDKYTMYNNGKQSLYLI